MTVTSQTNSVAYAGNGTTGPFPVPFYFFANTDLVVMRRNGDGSSTPLALTSDYSVSGAANPSGGSITLNAPIASGNALTIYRDVPLTQDAAYVDHDRFPASSHERALDRGVMMEQRTRQIALQGLRVGETDVDGSGVFDGRGNRISNVSAPVALTDAARLQDIVNASLGVGPGGVITDSVFADNTINGVKLKDGAVMTTKIADGAVTMSKFAAASVGNSILADGSVTGSKLADSAVSGGKIAAGTITADKIAAGVIPSGSYTPADNSIGGVKLVDASVSAAKLGSDVLIRSSSFGTMDLHHAPAAVGIGSANPLIPFGGFQSQSYINKIDTVGGRGSASIAALTVASTSVGSGANGPGSTDLGAIVSSQKTNWMTSTVDGEIDSLYVIGRQGGKGDLGGVDIDMMKVHTGAAGQYGGITPVEIQSGWSDTSGNFTICQHVILGFMEDSSGPSHGTGYGVHVNVWKGITHSGVRVTSQNELGSAAGSYGYGYVLSASHDDANANDFFAIRGTSVTGFQQPGDICIGNFTSGFNKTLRVSSTGGFQIRNAADTTSIMVVKEDNGGTVQILGSGRLIIPSGADIAQGTPAGVGGSIQASATYLYVSVGPTQWKRVLLSDF